MQKLVQFGAGNIGRSFIGQLFARAGFEVVFVDVDPRIVAAMNERHSYRVDVKDNPPDEILVKNIRAVNGNDHTAVIAEIATARLAGTAVGANALPHIYPVLASGLAERCRRGCTPLDVILCENLHHAASIVRAGLRNRLPADFPLDSAIGLIETSIGKMVPIVPQALREQDPLLVAAEAYNTLIVDALAFKNPIPRVPGLAPKKNMSAYVDRKLYIHNLGHAAVAYEAARAHPEIRAIVDAVRVPEVRDLAQGSMRESAMALLHAYPGEFTAADLEAHIQDLLRRFENPALGDTVYRVGRDIRRKLSCEDRIIGAMILDLDHGISPAFTTHVAVAAMQFHAKDDTGVMDQGDVDFHEKDVPLGIDHVLTDICGLDPSNSIHAQVRSLIKALWKP